MATASTAVDTGTDRVYALGHAVGELDRLTLQARVLEPYTRHLFIEAGIAPGMRVLDVGCGTGDVSFLVAEIVGPSGEVVGIDKAEPAVARATNRAHRRGVGNVRFAQADLLDLDFGRPFDAVVGRLVLMYLPDPAAALASLARLVKQDGLLVFHEFDIGAARAFPETPLNSHVFDCIARAFLAAGAELRMGMKLHAAFTEAGLHPPSIRLDGIMGGSPDFVGYQMAADLIRTLLPLIQKAGIASAEELGVDTLAARLRDEVAASGSVMVLPELIGAWGRKRRDGA